MKKTTFEKFIIELARGLFFNNADNRKYDTDKAQMNRGYLCVICEHLRPILRIFALKN